VELRTNSFWDEVKEMLAKKMSVPSFETWIKNTTATIHNDRVIIECENEFQRDWIQVRYSELIAETIQHVLGQRMNVVLTVDGELQQLERQHNAAMSLRDYIVALEERIRQLEERVERCEQSINKWLQNDRIH
jgi:chromosomal replication initiation ATPase DnaA